MILENISQKAYRIIPFPEFHSEYPPGIYGDWLSFHSNGVELFVNRKRSFQMASEAKYNVRFELSRNSSLIGARTRFYATAMESVYPALLFLSLLRK